ncbi:MAG: ATP-dependent sacrificial sulfur transferase LarE [Planctomycetes bacterium]|nr:ATP-dependent sacrificial sulfur transferase LarE [Planctomycetota bacterium]MCH8119706.1 ATP-dependent sacrificial sulfur transferase LarE [Planctomycetota bacterium]
MTLQDKYNLLQQILKKLHKVIVAYSGGVDSTFLLKAAVDTLGPENVLACIGISSSLAKSQYNRAIECAEIIGARVEEVEVQEVFDTKYSANNPDRCFHCKSHLYTVLQNIAKEKGFDNVVCGCNFDDMDDFRPGNKAAKIYGVQSPLMEARMTKEDIRDMSRKLKLPTADIPASPCLASRVMYGLEVTEQRLKQVEEAEDFLRKLGFVEFRVRHHDTIARIEVHPEDMEKVTTEPERYKIVEKLKSLGFKYITVDLQGFRSGSLNELLTKDEKQSNR